ncbi:uncharacterized protein Gasu_63530 [Galdieria sulphuraria]|uniref:Uncharacterized protein n=1 Tax=Galdieria sulphuraria TaxID=130081 RepID=M2XQT1_GALSU|nr:uncharacterized protein Gasu_63530 [Galdieria sulphuraria]EME25993.1 hypothetical protein Gasu_63530 [Galdieria sulphuraria]|eukprot:XP_005702513.1 hypothetical protein Gasu_63530 [Galdieria sulphuraria]
MEKLLQAFRCFYLVEEIVCEGATTACCSEWFSHCPWFALLSVAHQMAIDRCYRGLCEELNQLVIFLGQNYSSVPWTLEDLQKLVNRQKLQLMLQSISRMNDKTGIEAEEQSHKMQQWECLYRFHDPNRYTCFFLDMALECYLDDFIHRPNQTLVQQIRRIGQRVIRMHPWHYPISYAYLLLMSFYYVASQKYHMPFFFSSIPSKPSPKTCAGDVIHFLIHLLRILSHPENISIESIRSCCKEAIAFIEETRKYRLCSLGHIEYLFRWVRCFYNSNQLENNEQDEDWKWLQKYRFAYFEQDWQRLEWILMKKRHCDACRWEWNEIGKQHWFQEKNPLAAIKDWNIALSLPLEEQSNDILMNCFHSIRKALHIDDQREKSRTLCLLAFHDLYYTKELEWAEKRLIQATQNDAFYQLPFALLGFLFEYLSLDVSSSSVVVYQNRAIKCYQRCLLLSHQHQFASWRLFRLYSKTQQIQLAQQLLQQLTSDASCNMAWPYILLGSFQLSLGKNWSLPTTPSSYFQTGLRYMRKDERKAFDEDGDLFIYLEPLLQDTMSILQSQCMESTAWLGLCDAYAADGRLSAALASCTRGLASLEKTCQQSLWTQPQLEMIYHRQLSYRVKKGRLLALLNRLEEAVEELESIANDQNASLSSSWKCTLGQVYFKQAVSQFGSNGLYQRALNTLDKAISCFSLQNAWTDLALIDHLGIALCTKLYFQTRSPHNIMDSEVKQSIRIIGRLLHRYPHHINNYMYWAWISLWLVLFPQQHSSLLNHPRNLSQLAIRLIHSCRQSLLPKHLLFVSFTSCLLLATKEEMNSTRDLFLSTLSLLGKLPANKRYSHVLVSLFFAALWLPLDEAIAYAFIQDALRRDPCNDTAWLLLGMWRERKWNGKMEQLDAILSCYFEAIRLASNPMALSCACSILRKLATPQSINLAT